MAHARLIFFGCVLACGGATTKPIATNTPPEPAAFTGGARMQHFHSTRFSVSLPLPDGPRWRIDDHKTPMLRATHEATHSVIELAIWREEDLMNRAKCEERARQKSFAKELAAEEIDAEVISFPQGWDTGVSIGVEQNADGEKKEVTGHLVVFAAYLRKCMTFHFSTRVDAADAAVLSDRLAFVRLRVFGQLQLDSFDIQRLPERPPTHL